MLGILLAHLYIISFGFLPAPRTWTMTGRVMAGETLQRKNVKIEDISPALIAAVIAAEDARFCRHKGIDFDAVEKAIEHNKKGGRRRGGSTITQQTAKNLFFWNGGGIVRKAGEAYVALLIDALWSKSTILQHYLNVAEWGDGIFGAEAAAQARFGKSAKDLSSYEAALLASVLPSPNKWRLDPPSEFVSGRARTINARLKVTAREGYGDCVLNTHPAYQRRDFRAAPKPPETAQTEKEPQDISDSTDALEIESAEETIEPQETPSPASTLEDILTEAQAAAQEARTDSEQIDTQDVDTPPSKALSAPKDIRPPPLTPAPIPAPTEETPQQAPQPDTAE